MSRTLATDGLGACKHSIAACNLVPMPELPDIAAYLTALEARILGQPLERLRVASPFLLRTAHPSLETAYGKRVRELRRIGKRIAVGFEDELWLVLHLMIAGRLHWKASVSADAGKAKKSSARSKFAAQQAVFD